MPSNENQMSNEPSEQISNFEKLTHVIIVIIIHFERIFLMSGLLVQEWRKAEDPHLGPHLVAGRKGLEKRIAHSQVQKMGLGPDRFYQVCRSPATSNHRKYGISFF